MELIKVIAIIKIEYDEIVGGDEWKLLFGV